MVNQSIVPLCYCVRYIGSRWLDSYQYSLLYYVTIHSLYRRLAVIWYWQSVCD